MRILRAFARVQGETVRGCVTFRQERCGVWVDADIWGLPDSGFFALHIHEGGSCAGEGFPDTGNHWNPSGSAHPMHPGDLPPLLSCGGHAQMTVLTNRFRLEDVLGRTVVIHSGSDDFRSQPSGNAGTKIACGVIRIR